ncbi:NAD(P)H-binding protein [Stappia sp. GBMRC 2046]|uniref:NAD(P)H-binding protein n=1 Tax=Stappia sediminis TaxID=2692190 RepID=A0A7X3LS73_9HYPH|nr:NAD-dependent epimerase/dehydratase family protein [Stappia sediminis]MXN64134.1 NAD(P)H-binding protein [Stappia sediminis]
MDIFLTGGTGTIGQHVLRRLQRAGHRITALARSDRAEMILRDQGVDIVRGDLNAPDAWVADAVYCDTLVHAGASFDETMGPSEKKLVAALRRATIGREIPFNVVYTGGIWLYPDSGGKPLPETIPFRPLPAFAFMAETIRSLQAIQTLGVSVIHPALVCSPVAGPVSDMLRMAEEGLPYSTRATPETVWPLVDADDLADLYLRAVEEHRYRIMVVGCGVEGVKVGELADTVSRSGGLTLELAHEEPEAGANPQTDWQAGYALSQSFGFERAKRLLGWRPRLTRTDALVGKLTPIAA